MERLSLKQVVNGERFYRVPKEFFESNYYEKMSSDSKLLYGILKDRFELSLKNNWIDKDGNIYFIFTIEEIGKMIGCGKDKAIKIKKELAKYELLEEVRQGLNKPNLIYLGVVKTEKAHKTLTEAEVGKSEVRTSENQSSGSRKIRSQKFDFSEGNDTDISDTDISDTELIISEEEEEKPTQNSKNKNPNSLFRKVDKATKYDKEYIYDLVFTQLLEDDYSATIAAYIMMPFEERYKYALENMRFARSSEMVAEYIYNGLLAAYNSTTRKRME